MTSLELTPHDIDVLQKIKDPECAPSPVLIDAALPRDPHVTNSSDYERASSAERHIVLRLQHLEIQQTRNHDSPKACIEEHYSVCITQLDDLIAEFPKYASAYNNKAQALRRLYGDSIFLKTPSPLPSLISIPKILESDLVLAAATILHTLDTAISLLSPITPFTPISRQAAKTLSQAYTQRGALLFATAKQMASNCKLELRLDRGWEPGDLEEMASRDFAMGGRYGNDIARGLAVATNPTAKLCGNIVKEAMRKEFKELDA